MRSTSRRRAVLAVSGLVLALACAGFAAAQHTAMLAGTWNVRLEYLSGRVFGEQWIVEQDGIKAKGVVRTANRDYPLEGTVKGNAIEMTVSLGQDRYELFLGTIGGDSITGEMKKPGDDAKFFAKRTGSR